MSFLHGQGGGMVGGGAGGGRGGRGGRGHGGGDDEEALIRSVRAKKRAARRYLIQGGRLPPSLADYAPDGRYFNHLPPLGRDNGGHAAPAPGALGAQPPPVAVHEHLFAHDDAEEALYIAQVTAASIAEMRRRDDEEIAAQMAVHRAREARERAAKRARMDGAVPSYAVHSDDSE